MQMYADVTRRELSLIESDQGPALGSAMHAAVAAGCYPDIEAADGGDGQGPARPPTRPTRAARARTTRCTRSTQTLHDYFGRGANEVMHRLRRIRRGSRRMSDDAVDGSAPRGAARCTPSSCATTWSRGRAATSRRACPARS